MASGAFSAPFVVALGIEPVSAAAGECESVLRLRPDHLQQNAFVHGGVQATIADHTAGTAAATLIGPDELVLTAQLNITLLRAAKGEFLHCHAKVLKGGARLSVVEAEVFCETGGECVLVSKALVTLAVVKRTR